MLLESLCHDNLLNKKGSQVKFWTNHLRKKKERIVEHYEESLPHNCGRTWEKPWAQAKKGWINWIFKKGNLDDNITDYMTNDPKLTTGLGNLADLLSINLHGISGIQLLTLLNDLQLIVKYINSSMI